MREKEMNEYKQFIEETGQSLRFIAWRYTKKIERKKT
jgi:hypothetical protein